MAFRLLAICFGFAIVLLTEGALRLTNIGRISDPGDPFVGFSERTPLFELNADGDRLEIAKSRQVFFQPDSCAATKGPSEFRIFCLGGSTVQGRPYSIETSFTTWLELNLQAADSSRDWQVVNCGGVSYASYRLVPILQEVVDYSPDLLVVYTGHNEFLEDRTYSDVKTQPKWVMHMHERLVGWRIYNAAYRMVRRDRPPQPSENLPAEVDALLDFQGGLAEYHRDEAWRDGVIKHYELNLRRMVRIAREANVPIVFVNPVSNVRDTPPFKVERAAELSDEDFRRFEEAWQKAKVSDWEHLEEKEKLVRQVLAIDSRHAEARFLLAKVYEAMGEIDLARKEYLQAKDEDICPLRMLETMYESLQEVCQQSKSPLIDIRAEFERTAEFGIPGDNELIDHVHPRIEGHQMIAKKILEYMVGEKIVNAVEDWEDRAKPLYRANYESLPSNYFPESQARLDGLKRWTQGRVTRLRIDGDPTTDD